MEASFSQQLKYDTDLFKYESASPGFCPGIPAYSCLGRMD